MTGRDGPKASSEFGLAEVGQLIGVDLETEAEPFRLAQQRIGFVETEDAGFTEDVAELGQTAANDFRQDLIADQGEIGATVGGVLRRHGVSAEEGWHQLE